jgi:hypothetical protein
MSVAVETSTPTTLSFGRPTQVLDVRAFTGGGSDVSRDGQKFLMIKNARTAGQQQSANTATGIVVVLDWVEELKQRLPTK